jgi:hypothetical protein
LLSAPAAGNIPTLLRFSPEFDPVSNLLTLQTELERYLHNPAIRLGVSGPGDFPPLNISMMGGVVVIAEIPGMDPSPHTRHHQPGNP